MVNAENQILIFNDSEPVKPKSKKIRIIHFNDVYNIEGFKTEPSGSASRFKTALNHFKNKETLVFFSGDAFSPSTLSLFSKGNQIVECLNKMNIHAALVGNHEFDMGVDILKKLVVKSNFPWLCSNLYDPETSKPFLDFKTYAIASVGDVKIGVIGLVEKEWVCSLSAVSFDDIRFEDFITVSRYFARILKNEKKCDIVIALTHMRWNNDTKLAERVPEIDIILGGHDHDYEVRNIKNRWVIKSGCDFKEFSVIEIEIKEENKTNVKSIKKIVVDSKISEDPEIKEITQRHLTEADKKLDEALGVINRPLDGTFDSVRTKETNLGNFLCDIILSSVNADCAIINGGSLRSDRIHPSGNFTRRDLRSILPFDSELVVVEITGKELHELLENCIAKYELKGGRFPQISGLFFTYCISNNPGNRVCSDIIKVQDEYLDLTKKYRLATNTFLRNVDPVLKQCKTLVHSENIPFLYTLVENFFKTVKNLKENNINANVHRSQIIPKVIIDSLMKKYSKDPEVIPPNKIIIQHDKSHLTFKLVAKLVLKTLKYRKVLLYKDKKIIKNSEKFRKNLEKYERKSLEMAPECENRSISLKDEKELLTFLNEKQIYMTKLVENQ